MELPRHFPGTSPSAIASYDAQDIIVGTGFVTYYLATTKDSVGSDYILTRDGSTYSNDEELVAGGFLFTKNNSSFAKQYDLDFDLSEAQVVQIFEGEGIIQVTWGCSLASSADTNGIYLIFKLRKYDGSTETEIASAQTETKTDDDSTALKTSLVTMTVPKTKLNIGDILRVTVEVWTRNDSATANIYGYLKHDPVNRNGTATNPNILKISLPQKLNL